MSTLASGSIDLKGLKESAGVATNFLSTDSSGVMVYDGTSGQQQPSSPSANTKNVLIDSNGMYVRNGSTNLASFTGSSAQIGQDGAAHSVVGANGMRIYASDGSTQIAHLGYALGNAETGTATAPYYTFGDRGGAIGNYSVTEGKNVVIEDLGQTTTYPISASGYASHAEGGGTTASDNCSHAEGYLSEASGFRSHAEGDRTIASGEGSHAQNFGTIAQGDHQTAIGQNNIADTTSALIIGNGTSSTRSNALTVDWNGNVNIASGATYKVNGSPLLDKYTRSSAGDLNWSSTTEGDAKVITKSALAFWNGAYSGNSSNLSKCSTGNIIGSNGGTMTGQLKTSFKESVAMGSYGASASTVPNLVAELRFSSGCMGSANISTAYTNGSITIGTGWYNFIYSPHRSGGANGAASGDNCNYGNLLLMGMTMGGAYLIRVASAAIQEVKILGSDYAKTTFTPTKGSSYSNFGGCYYEKYGRTVHVHLGLSGLTASTSATVFTLPSGYRPSSPVYAYGTGGSWDVLCYAVIGTGGAIDVRSKGAYCGADITFLT